jgi:membrane protein DedA with SNARE-associated domain
MNSIISASDFHYLVETYGYWAILAGTFFEGETILIIGGVLARFGLLELPYVILAAVIGSLAGDQLYYYMGYYKGRDLVSRHPGWERKINRAYELLERYRNPVMLGFRFVYGMRMVIPFCIGLVKDITRIRFFLFNLAGAVIWSAAVSVGGYLFGHVLEPLLKDIEHYEIYAMAGIALVGIIIWSIHKYRGGRNKAKSQDT